VNNIIQVKGTMLNIVEIKEYLATVAPEASANSYKCTLNTLTSINVTDFVEVVEKPIEIAKKLKATGLSEEKCSIVFKHVKAIVALIEPNEKYKVKLKNIAKEEIDKYNKIIVKPVYHGTSNNSEIDEDELVDAVSIANRKEAIQEAILSKQVTKENCKEVFIGGKPPKQQTDSHERDDAAIQKHANVHDKLRLMHADFHQLVEQVSTCE
jgi:hypothetical protein